MQSSIKYRPKSLDKIIGNERVIKQLRGAWNKNKFPQALMFTGPKGVGKTSFAQIVALAVQCKHKKVFGSYCEKCRARRASFPIYYLNCGKVRGVEEIERFIKGAEHDIVLGRAKRKVFILDEAHRLSGHSQDVLLVPFEKADKNLWIINTTKPEKIVDTLASRCQVYTLKPFNRDEIELYVRRLLKAMKSKLSVSDLTDALVDKRVTSARLIANAADKYVSGATAEEAAEVEGSATINSKALIRAVIKGDWADTAKVLKKAPASDVRLLRAGIIKYLGTILLDYQDKDSRAKAIAESIKGLAYVSQAEESIMLDALSAELYTLCTLFEDNQL